MSPLFASVERSLDPRCDQHLHVLRDVREGEEDHREADDQEEEAEGALIVRDQLQEGLDVSGAPLDRAFDRAVELPTADFAGKRLRHGCRRLGEDAER